jgi:hypothetical protein
MVAMHATTHVSLGVKCVLFFSYLMTLSVSRLYRIEATTMNVEQMEWDLAGETQVLGENAV